MTHRVFNQWRSLSERNWCFVPFSIWGSDDFWGIVIFNFCFEFARTKSAARIHEAIR